MTRILAKEKTVSAQPRVAWWEWLVVGSVCAVSLLLGFANLGKPSLWHDELVHVFVAKSLVAHGWPTLPGGAFYPSSTACNVLMSLFVALFGDGAVAVRSPSVLLSALNAALLYLVTRRLAGRNVALLAVVALTLSPWHVAWARQARLYQLQAAAYLLTTLAAWLAFEAKERRAAVFWGFAALGGFALGMLTSYHSLLFLGPVGGYAVLMLLYERRWQSRYSAAIAACTVAGLLTIALLALNPNPVDRSAVFDTGLGGLLKDPQRIVRFFYLRWLGDNLSVGFVAMALLGTGLMLWRERGRGLFLAGAFWIPVLVLTFLIGYRRPRFMFFAFPFYIVLFSYAIVWMLGGLAHCRKSLAHGLLALGILAFTARLAFSGYLLAMDSIEAASGADLTLAREHPQWKPPCAYVREHIDPGDAVLGTTYLPVLYYVGRADNWFPNRFRPWERQESGLQGLASLPELKAYLREHPRGYFLAEHVRFELWQHHVYQEQLLAEVTWVRENMVRVEAASSRDVTVYRWDFTARAVP